MQLDDFNITAEYMEYSDSSNKSEWGNHYLAGLSMKVNLKN